jgi:hypothetical protein
LHDLLNGVGKGLLFGFFSRKKADKLDGLLFRHQTHLLPKILLSALLNLLLDLGISDHLPRFPHLVHLHVFELDRAVLDNVLGLVAQDGFDKFIEDYWQLCWQRNGVEVPTGHFITISNIIKVRINLKYLASFQSIHLQQADPSLGSFFPFTYLHIYILLHITPVLLCRIAHLFSSAS